jgi:hypothetical protein
LDQQIQTAVIQKQANQLANALLQATILEARLEAAEAELQQFRAEAEARAAAEAPAEDGQ